MRGTKKKILLQAKGNIICFMPVALQAIPKQATKVFSSSDLIFPLAVGYETNKIR